MKESTIIMRNGARSIPRGRLPMAMEETFRLYHAWLGYLLTRMQADTVRIKASEMTAARDSFTCTVTREGDEYVIRLDRAEGA